MTSRTFFFPAFFAFADDDGANINITATMSEAVIQGSSFTVTLGTTDQIVLTAASTGTTLTGTYTIGANDNSSE